MPERLALMIVTGLIVAQSFNYILFEALPPPRPKLFGVRGLSNLLSAALIDASATPFKTGGFNPHAQSLGPWITLSEQKDDPGGVAIDPSGPDSISRFAATIASRTPQLAEIRIFETSHGAHPAFDRSDSPSKRGPSSSGVIYIPPRDLLVQARSGALGDQEPETYIGGPFHVAFRLLDGRWIIAEEADVAHFIDMRRLQFLLWFVIIAGVVALVAQWFARRETAPLMKLVQATEQIGRHRGPLMVDVKGNYEVGVLSAALNKMQTRVQRVIDDRTLMLAAISHDLRTPLTRIRLAAETSQASSLRSELVTNIEEMETMIEASLHFASEDAVREVFSKTDVAVMVMSLCDDLNDRHGKAEYRGPEHAILVCQPLALKRALNNVIENAWKFAGEAIVELTDELEIVRLEVRDFGPGIPPDKVDAAFAPFGRLESTGTQKPGSGLGLTIARDVIRAHGGEIALEPNEPAGLVVRIHIPRGANLEP